MLEYTQGGSGARFELLVLHDDAAREYAYGPALGLPEPKLGAFTQPLYDEAKKEGWTVASMKGDWSEVFPFEPSPRSRRRSCATGKMVNRAVRVFRSNLSLTKTLRVLAETGDPKR